MKPYLLSLAAGVLVGFVYSLINVRSPAPPIIALLGLLGILGGEQIIPVIKHLLSGSSISTAWHRSHAASHIFGSLPGRHAARQTGGPPDHPETL
jgi:XapX domain-containing protein